MPSSPPPTNPNQRRRRTSRQSLNQPSSSSVIVRTADSTTDDELLHLIENARSAVERARELTSPSYVNNGTTPAQDDSAATSLFERHTNRRDMELEWDERDTERRARELMQMLAQDPPPNHLVDVDDHARGGGGDEGEEHDGLQARTGSSAGEIYGFPTFGGILRDSDDEEEGDDGLWYEPANVEEAIFGFDGEGTDEDFEGYEDMDDTDMLRGETLSSRTASRAPAIWPGFLGEQPLNVDDVPPTQPSPPVIDSAPKPSIDSTLPLDPSSSTSYTSFLTPGSIFFGQQVTNAKSSTSSGRSSGSRSSASTAWPPFAPFPSATARRVGNPSPPALRPYTPSTSTSSPLHYAYMPTADSISTNRPSSSSSSSRYAPYSSHTAVGTPSTNSAATVPSAPIPPNLTPVERARINIARSANPNARSNPASWREVADELLVRMGGDEQASTEGHPTRGSAREEERWEVQVNIHSYDPSVGTVTGLMSAYGIQSPQRDLSRHPTRVTTFFSASIIQPLRNGLFVSPSPTGSGGSSPEGIRVSQSTEAESWIQVGPFKGMKKNELLERAKDRIWVEEKSKGWVLMRWKEKDFVNVKATESSLSINGFYFVALNRSTGVIEGLYSDPASSPHQRLDLSPMNEGAFGLGTYSMC
ncbi:uncharacterized protein JCM6883_004124 [Sporobolomyces salmoneus]|uniref:uncharacterized protein n=1 Tax=Sporobolomyces salmoneus TaxID=183962 RepID=UPI0031709D08